MNSSSGVISGTVSSVGTFTVPISATNAGGTANATLTITITPGAVPVISSDAATSAVVGSSFSYYIYASNPPVTYGATNLPNRLSVDTSSGLVSGTATNAGTFVVPISATNSAGTGSAVLTISIGASPSAPVISSAASATGTLGSTFSYLYSGKQLANQLQCHELASGTQCQHIKRIYLRDSHNFGNLCCADRGDKCRRKRTGHTDNYCVSCAIGKSSSRAYQQCGGGWH